MQKASVSSREKVSGKKGGGKTKGKGVNFEENVENTSPGNNNVHGELR